MLTGWRVGGIHWGGFAQKVRVKAEWLVPLLLGVDSVVCAPDIRKQAWERLAKDLPLGKLCEMTETVGLSDVLCLGKRILSGESRGRTVVNVNA